MLCSSRAGRCGKRSETHWCGNKVRKETTCGCRFDPEEILRETRRVALNWPVRCAVIGPTWSVHETSSEAVTKWWGWLYAEIIWLQRRWSLFFGVWPRTKWRLDQLEYLIKESRNEGIGSRSFIITSLPGGEVMMPLKLEKRFTKETKELSVRLAGWSCTVLMPWSTSDLLDYHRFISPWYPPFNSRNIRMLSSWLHHVI